MFDILVLLTCLVKLTIAARLTEDPDVTVGVIEAGKIRLDDFLVDTPAMFIAMLGNPEYDWNFKTTPQTGNKNIVHHMPRGKMLGGSTGNNYMMYVRGSDADYDDWATLVDDSSWSSANMKPYMRKHQTLEPIDDKVTDRSTMPFVGEHHGTSGPVRTSFNDWRLPIEDDLVKAADEAAGSMKRPTDPWSGDHIGFFNTLGSVARTGPNKGKRSYAARGYYEPNAHRPNLKVITESMVAKIVLEDKTAKGVEFLHDGQKHSVKANREVIVCGGAIQSPQMLELSGIGDAKVLEAAGVECKVELPSVGNDFQDHVITAMCFQVADGMMTGDSLHKPEVMAMAQKALAETQGGPLTCIQSIQGFFPVSQFLEEDELNKIVESFKTTDHASDFQKKQRELVLAHIKDPKSANLQLVVCCVTANYVDGQKDQSR